MTETFDESLMARADTELCVGLRNAGLVQTGSRSFKAARLYLSQQCCGPQHGMINVYQLKALRQNALLYDYPLCNAELFETGLLVLERMRQGRVGL